MKRAHPISIFFFLFTEFLSAQALEGFQPYDWILYSDITSVNSISEGNNYAYLGTETAGILRWDFYGRYFSAPITSAQGLASNHVSAVYFDHNTGILWAATPNILQYSYTQGDDWFGQSFDNLGLPAGSEIEQIGSSQDFIWCRTPIITVKCDRSSGIMLGHIPVRDEDEINWGSHRIQPYDTTQDFTDGLVIAGNWNFFGDGLIDHRGHYVDMTTVYAGQFQDFWVGTNDRVLFLAGNGRQRLEAKIFGLNNRDVQFIEKTNGLWVGGRQGQAPNHGVTYLDPERGVWSQYDFEYLINANPQSLYSALVVGDEIWFGGEGQILIYDQAEDWWRSLDEAQGVPPGAIRSLASKDENIWIGSERGLGAVSSETRGSIILPVTNPFVERKINAIQASNDRIWVATNQQLAYFDNQTSGFKNLPVSLPAAGGKQVINRAVRGYSALFDFKNKLFAASSSGILQLDEKQQRWTLAAPASVYHNQYVRKLAVSEDYFWLVTARALFRVDRITLSIRVYDYGFMGYLNDVYISEDELWIGTSKGLLNFNWQGDL